MMTLMIAMLVLTLVTVEAQNWFGTQCAFRFWQSFLFFIGSAFVTLLGLIVVPIAILQMGESRDLPKWAWMWGNDKDHDGDIYWQEKYPNGAHTSFWKRFEWFALRNTAYNFGMRYGSFLFDSGAFLLVDQGDPLTTNRDAADSDGGHEGHQFRVAQTGDGRKYPMIYFVKQWGNSGRCLEIYLGWKLRGENKVGDRIEPVFRINPLMGFERKN